MSSCGTPSTPAPKQELSVSDEEGAQMQPLSSRAPPPSGPTETAPPDEPDTIRKILSLIESSYAKRGRQSPVLRMAFAKGNGCAPGSLVISQSIPLYLRWGVFSKPGKSFPLWARFSGANGGTALPDTAHDSRGFAIKVLGVVGQKLLEDSEKGTQDFVFQNAPSFPAKDAQDLLIRMTAAQSHPPYEVGAAFRGTGEPVGNPLNTRYWSVFPTHLGDTAVKYRAVPSDCKSGKSLPVYRMRDGSRGEFLRESVKSTLSRGRACFLLEAQSWKDLATTPIEDATVVWTSPFERVAWIVLERQDAASFARNSAECEKMSFSPWHGIIEQQPLGSLGRLAKEAYSLSARIRRKMNNWPEREPPGP
jgi:hypothetical protein